MTGASTPGTGALPLRDDLRGRTPYGAPQIDVPVRLNVNENPYGPNASVVAAIGTAVQAVATELNRYPDREAIGLRKSLSTYLRGREGLAFETAQIWAANGSNEVMLHLMQAFGGPGRRALGFTPTYSMYPDYCRDTFTEYVTAPRGRAFVVTPEAACDAVREHRPDLVLLASPNNPTGTALDLDVVRAVHAEFDGLVVVDEAYAEFRRPGTPTALRLVGELPRVVVTRTMSKAFALAGARVGYAVADPAVVDALQLVRLPYHLSAVTQAVASAALAHAPSLLAGVDRLRDERDALAAHLIARGFEVATSDANFVLFGRFPDRHAVWTELLDHGVLIRETGPEGWLRVSVGTPDEMMAFRSALDDVAGRHPVIQEGRS